MISPDVLEIEPQQLAEKLRRGETEARHIFGDDEPETTETAEGAESKEDKRAEGFLRQVSKLKRLAGERDKLVAEAARSKTSKARRARPRPLPRARALPRSTRARPPSPAPRPAASPRPPSRPRCPCRRASRRPGRAPRAPCRRRRPRAGRPPRRAPPRPAAGAAATSPASCRPRAFPGASHYPTSRGAGPRSLEGWPTPGAEQIRENGLARCPNRAVRRVRPPGGAGPQQGT